MVESLLATSKGTADPTLDKRDWTALHYAAAAGASYVLAFEKAYNTDELNTDKSKATWADLLKKKDRAGKIPAIIAIENGFLDPEFRSLFNLSTIYIQDSEGNNSLHSAVLANNPETIRQLLVWEEEFFELDRKHGQAYRHARQFQTSTS